MASANEIKLNIAKEASEGVLPSSPVWKALRTTGEVDLGVAINTTESKEVRQDRQYPDVIKTSEDSSGSFNIEMSPQSHDILLEGCLFNTFSVATAPITSNAISATITSGVKKINVASGALTTKIKKGDWFKASGFSTAVNNGYYQALSVLAGSITLKNAPVGFVAESAGSNVTLKLPSRLINGIEKKSYTIEEEIFEGGSSDKVQKFKGSYIDSINFDINTDSEITGSVSVISKDMETDTSLTDSTTVLPASKVFSSNNVLSFSLLGEDTVKNFVSSSSFSISNGIEGLRGLGIQGYAELPAKKCTVEASFSVYLNDLSLVKKARLATKFSLTYLLTSSEGDYIIDIPAIVLGGDSSRPKVGDTDGFITADMTGKAILDSELGYQIAIYKL